ncbi:hypothetical protein C5167_018392 [Papaver somniferum]|uniref:Uncharacterized protein n=1 Tax=Papaver somniferum TaxID=3469 RepID=A0A4Y7IR71_PAPSO|nr:hypothetical protein C5167_018392 [Papaver somniferum]
MTALQTSIGTLVSEIAKALKDQSSTSNLKIEALIFTGFVIFSHSPSVFHPSIKMIAAMKHITLEENPETIVNYNTISDMEMCRKGSDLLQYLVRIDEAFRHF